MPRPVTLFTGQWADLPLTELAKKAHQWDYDGLELACWGDHFSVTEALKNSDYCAQRHEILAQQNLKVWAISNHLVGQMVCDPNDFRTDGFAPKALQGKPEEKRKWAIDEMLRTAEAAKRLGVSVVNGFTGSSIWHLLYSFPPYDFQVIEAGFQFFAEKWRPILDEFQKNGVKFALEVHPTEIAFDIITAQRALKALNQHPAFGFNFDPSHLQWQGIDPARFLRTFAGRIFHVHIKDCIVSLDGEAGILASYLNFGEAGRGWDFRSPGRGEVDFEAIIRELNRMNYAGPLSVEWEDSGMDREHGAAEACRFVKDLDFKPSQVAFDAAFNQ
ncbi:sugar phosphate isomerase/epimerase [candidate division KSB1 bacterium]|nr:sugar phosphate isomerase/epimerase [candidate division KSB1 bacterium]